MSDLKRVHGHTGKLGNDYNESGVFYVGTEVDAAIAALKAERDDWREQAQRNDTPVKSAAEIGRDAILAAIKDCSSFVNVGGGDFSACYDEDLEIFANNLTANSGE